MSFENQRSFDERLTESSRIKGKYPDRIPVIIEKDPSCKDMQTIDKTKFLVPCDLTVGQLNFVVRKRIRLSPHESMFLFVGKANVIPPVNITMYEVYEQNMSEDGFLYMKYCNMATFGS